MYVTHGHNLFYKTMKYHKNIPNGFQVKSRHKNVYRRLDGCQAHPYIPEPFSRGIKRRGRQKKRWKDNIKEWTGMDLASLTWAFEQDKMERDCCKSNDLLRLSDKKEQNRIKAE